MLYRFSSDKTKNQNSGSSMPVTELVVPGLPRDFARLTVAGLIRVVIAARSGQGFCSLFVSILAYGFEISQSQRNDEIRATTYHAVTKLF